MKVSIPTIVYAICIGSNCCIYFPLLVTVADKATPMDGNAMGMLETSISLGAGGGGVPLGAGGGRGCWEVSFHVVAGYLLRPLT